MRFVTDIGTDKLVTFNVGIAINLVNITILMFVNLKERSSIPVGSSHNSKPTKLTELYVWCLYMVTRHRAVFPPSTVESI